MNKEFIPYEEALALKELGFDEPCMAWHDTLTPDVLINTSHYHSGKWNYLKNAVSLPLYQQAFRWFRDKHNLFHNIWNYTHAEPTNKLPNGFAFSIDEDWICIVGKLDGKFEKYYDTYEEAELECLKKLIEIVKKK